MGKVFSLLGISFLFTAIGAYASTKLGPAGWGIGLIASFISYIALMFARERSPLNLILLYVFTFAEGLLLGGILERYVQAGMGGAVVDAAVTTAIVAVAVGGYGATTRRNLSGLAPVLMMGTLALFVALLIGIFVHLTGFYLAVSVIGALLFTVWIAVDMQRVARTQVASQGGTIMMAISIYLDLINLFLFILDILGLVRRSD